VKADKYSKEGVIIGEIDLSENVFNSEINDVLIYELIKSANANMRQGTHKTKQRAEVSGGGCRPWRQKGTGRARQGSIRAPQWRKGGTIFGPIPRSYRIDLPGGIKKKAYISLLSLKFKEGAIKIIEDFNVVDGKTKEMAKIGKALKIEKGIIISDNEDGMLKRAIKNIPWFSYNNVKRLSSRDIFYSKSVLITEGAAKFLNEKYGRNN
jgi:large subunit ribosomal protein L4